MRGQGQVGIGQERARSRGERVRRWQGQEGIGSGGNWNRKGQGRKGIGSGGNRVSRK